MSQLTLIVEIVTSIVLGVMLLLVFFFINRKFTFISKRLDDLEKETRTIEDNAENNTMSLADIHGIVSSIDEKTQNKKRLFK